MKDLLVHCPYLVEGDEVPFLPWRVIQRARSTRSRMESSPTYRWWVMAIVLGGFFSTAVTVTILSVAIPDIARELDSSQATVSWIVTGPFLAFAVLQPTLGKLGDLFGHKRLYIGSFLLEFVAALLIASSWNAPSLIVFRIVGGVVGAAAGPASMAMLFAVFAPRERVKAMGWWSFVAAGSPVIGVVIGGPIIEHFSWRWIFIGQAPLCLAAFVLGALLLPDKRPHLRPRFDLKGSFTLTLAVASAMLAVNRSSVSGWDSPFVVACILVAPIAAAAFVRIERVAASPLLPLGLIRQRNVLAPILVQFFGNFGYLGSFIITPLFLQEVMGFSASRAGLTVIARPLTFSIAAPIFGFVAARIGERFNAVAGMAAIVASMMVFSTIGQGSGQLAIYLALSLAGLGLGMASPSLNATVANSVPEEHLGVASAAVGMMSSIGGVLGMEVLRAFQSFREAAGETAAVSFRQAYMLGGVVCIGAFVSAFFVTRLSIEGEPVPAPQVEAA